MRVKLVLLKDDSTVLLVYPSTLDEYGEALETLAHPARAAGSSGPDPALAGRRPAHGCYVVTTEELRHRWGLPDLSADGRARVVTESRALDVLGDAAAWSAAAVQLSADAGAAPSPGDGKRDGSELAAVRALFAHGPRVDRVLAALDECGVLPRFVRKTARHALLQSLGSGKAAVEKALDRAAMAAALPWRTLGPVRFDPVHLKQVLDRTHGGLDRVKTRLVDVLAASPQTRGALTVEAPRRGKGVKSESSALVVFPCTSLAAARVPCLCGPPGTGKTALAVAVAEALGRPHVRVMLNKGSTEHLIRGQEGKAPGHIIRGLREAGLRNPVFILELLEQVEPEVAGALLDVLDPVVCTAFQDQYLQVRFDLSAVLWILTATDPGAIPKEVRKAPGGDRAAGLHRAREADHRRTAPAEAPVRCNRAGVGRVPGAGVGGAVPARGTGHRPRRSGRGGGTRGVVARGAGGVVGRAAVSRRCGRRVARGGVQRRRVLRDRGDPPGDPPPHG